MGVFFSGHPLVNQIHLDFHYIFIIVKIIVIRARQSAALYLGLSGDATRNIGPIPAQQSTLTSEHLLFSLVDFRFASRVHKPTKVNTPAGHAKVAYRGGATGGDGGDISPPVGETGGDIPPSSADNFFLFLCYFCSDFPNFDSH